MRWINLTYFYDIIGSFITSYATFMMLSSIYDDEILFFVLRFVFAFVFVFLNSLIPLSYSD